MQRSFDASSSVELDVAISKAWKVAKIIEIATGSTDESTEKDGRLRPA